MSITWSVAVCIGKMNISNILLIPNKCFTYLGIFDVHVKYIRHHQKILTIDKIQHSRTFIKVVDKVNLVSIHRFEDQLNPLRFSVIGYSMSHIQKEFMDKLDISMLPQ